MKIKYRKKQKEWIAEHILPSKAIGISSNRWLVFKISDKTLEGLKARLGPSWEEFMASIREPL